MIAGAIVLPNANGSAPGQWISGKYEGREKIIMLLPGPPHELKALFDEQCMERLRAKLPPQFMATRVLKIAMMRGVAVRCAGRAHLQALHRCANHDPGRSGRNPAAFENPRAHRSRRRSSAWTSWRKKSKKNSTTPFSPTTEIRWSRSSATTCRCATPRWRWPNPAPAGLLAERITSVSGSSRYFLGGAVVYSNQLKTAFADVPAELIEKHGAVSREVAAALAEGIRNRCGSTLGVGITGVAGPTGGTPEKPVGLVFHALASEKGTEVVERNFPGDRKRIRWFASQQALDMVRRKLM